MKEILGLFLTGPMIPGSSGVGHIWVMWKRGRFNFNPQVVDEQFISSSLTDLLSGLVWRHFVFMPLIVMLLDICFWRHLFEITSSWSSLRVVKGDFNAIKVHS